VRRFELELDPRGRRPLPDPGAIEDLRREVRDLGREIERIESLIEDLHRALGERRDPRPGSPRPVEERGKRVPRRKTIEGGQPPGDAPLPPHPPPVPPAPPPPPERDV
jgi:hypothetical protein